MTKYRSSERINSVEVTSDTITGRGGLALFSWYLETINIFGMLDNRFGHIRKSSKGIVVWILFKQVFWGLSGFVKENNIKNYCFSLNSKLRSILVFQRRMVYFATK